MRQRVLSVRRPAVDDGFEAMYRREVAPLTALALSLSGDRDAAVELVHEAMLRGLRDWHFVSLLDRPGAWVRRVMINIAIDRSRSIERERKAVVRLATELDRHSTTPAPRADPAFWTAVRALPERERIAVTLHYVEDRSIADIAEVMQIAVGTVKSSLFRARQSLAATLRTEEVTNDQPR